MMSTTRILALSAVSIALASCASDQQILASEQEQAVVVAARRGQFELSCPTAKGIVLSSNVLQPVLWNGIERAEYTVGVEGCGKKTTYIVVCQIGSVSCLAVSGRNQGLIP